MHDPGLDHGDRNDGCQDCENDLVETQHCEDENKENSTKYACYIATARAGLLALRRLSV